MFAVVLTTLNQDPSAVSATLIWARVMTPHLARRLRIAGRRLDKVDERAGAPASPSPFSRGDVGEVDLPRSPRTVGADDLVAHRDPERELVRPPTATGSGGSRRAGEAPVPAVLPCGPQAIGSARERTRCSSTVTMAPAATSGPIFGKTVARSALTRSMRDEARRREMTEGAACPDSATIAEKSRSWVTTARPSRRAHSTIS